MFRKGLHRQNDFGGVPKIEDFSKTGQAMNGNPSDILTQIVARMNRIRQMDAVRG